MRRRRQVRLERSRPIAVNAPFNSLAYVADHNPPHRHLQATGLQVPTLATCACWRIWIQQNCHLGSVRNRILEELHSFL
jgi:hypothetical protein